MPFRRYCTTLKNLHQIEPLLTYQRSNMSAVRGKTRKKQLLIITLLLIIPPLPATSAAQPKTGSICYKKGEVKIYNDKKYTCIKTGTKLRWSKPQQLLKPSPSHQQNPPGINLTRDLYTGVKDPAKNAAKAAEATISTSDGRLRSYLLFTPSTIDPTKPAPLIIALHGGLGNAKQKKKNTALSNYAETNGFYVLYPNGIGAVSTNVGPQSWNAGDCCGPAAKNKVDDVTFIKTLVNELKNSYAIDKTRIFAIGHSNGGMLAYRLACELSDTITAIGVQSASLGIKQCTPTNNVSAIHIHGTADKNMPIEGGVGSGVVDTPFQPARYAVDTLASTNKCEKNPEITQIKDNADVVLHSWSSCAETSTIRYITVNGASHAWMGHPAQSKISNSYIGTPYEKLDSTKAILSFLLLNPRSLSTTLPKEGTLCSKVGVTENYNGKKYTCIKSGSKTLWDKGEPTDTVDTTSSNNHLQIDLYSGVKDLVKTTEKSQEFTILTKDNNLRSYRLFTPSTIDPTKPAPLIIALHGGPGNAAQFELTSGLTEYAYLNKFYVVYPNGIKAIDNQKGPQSWNAGECCGPAARTKVDDVAFIKELITRLKSSYLIDSSRVLAIGFSNGGMLAYKLGCELSDIITGIGVQSATLGSDYCRPSLPVSLIHIHGTDDKNLPIEGGFGSGETDKPFRPALFAINTYANVNGCEINPLITKVTANNDLSVHSWKECQANTKMRYITVNGASHAWMGRPAISLDASTYAGTPYEKLDSTKAILSFLLHNPRL